MYNIQIAQKRPQNFVQNYNRKRLDKGADKPTEQSKGI